MADSPMRFEASREYLMAPDEPRTAVNPRVDPRPTSTIPARAGFALGVIYLLLLLVAAKLPAPDGVGASVVAILLFVFLPLGIIYHGVNVPLRAGVEVLSGLVSLAIWLAIMGLDTGRDAALIAPARSVALLAACLFFGMFASRIIKDRNLLVPALLVAAVADILSVGWGFTGHAIEHAPGLVAKLSVAVPTMAAAVPAEAGAPAYPLVATMGVGDIFFVALFFAAGARFGLPLRRTFCFVYPLVVIALAATVLDILPWKGVPGLPFICAGFLVANTKSFSLSKQEWQALGVVGALLAVLAGALFLVRHLAG